jgi:hypothetical protein
LPALQEVPEGPAPPVLEPPRLSPTERVAEILESFFLEDARLTTELLQELGKGNGADLVRLFIGPSTPADAPSVVDSVSRPDLVEARRRRGCRRECRAHPGEPAEARMGRERL